MVVSAAHQPRQFGVVVAVCKSSRGIGNGGQLPWRLRSDMAFFKQLTRSTHDPLKRNAVIMGRKTWQSIPSKFRPLDDRINVVLSRNAAARSELELPTNVLLAESLPQALEMLREDSEVGRDVENVFVIGGASVYAEALSMRGACTKLHITEIERAAPVADAENAAGNAPAPVAAGKADGGAPFECDVFFPELATDSYEYVEATRTPAKTESGLRYEFVQYAPRDGVACASVPLPSARAPHEENQYLDLVREVIEHGTRREDRTGVGTLSKFGVQMRFDLSEKFPLLTTKSVFWRGVAEELLWFLNGETSAKLLQDKKIRIWDGNSSREYLDSIGLTEREEGDLGPVYGWQWRHFGAEYTDMHADYTGQGVDQVAQVLHAIKNKPHDRRIIISAWNPADIPKMALPP
jgi:dihydrofolate reductase/thymidylate synthase